MKYKNQIILFLFTLIITFVKCKKKEEKIITSNKIKIINEDTLIHLTDLSKIIEVINTEFKQYWDGDYVIKTKAISNAEDHQVIDLKYYINIKGNKAILSIGAESSEDYWCEGDYYLESKDGGLYAVGKCDENDINDFMIKQNKNEYFIKSKRFENIDWQLLAKE